MPLGSQIQNNVIFSFSPLVHNTLPYGHMGGIINEINLDFTATLDGEPEPFSRFISNPTLLALWGPSASVRSAYFVLLFM